MHTLSSTLIFARENELVCGPGETVCSTHTDLWDSDGGLGLWGRDLREFMFDYNHYAGLGLVGECLLDDRNQVTLDPEDKDQYGLPVAV